MDAIDRGYNEEMGFIVRCSDVNALLDRMAGYRSDSQVAARRGLTKLRQRLDDLLENAENRIVELKAASLRSTPARANLGISGVVVAPPDRRRPDDELRAMRSELEASRARERQAEAARAAAEERAIRQEQEAAAERAEAEARRDARIAERRRLEAEAMEAARRLAADKVRRDAETAEVARRQALVAERARRQSEDAERALREAEAAERARRAAARQRALAQTRRGQGELAHAEDQRRLAEERVDHAEQPAPLVDEQLDAQQAGHSPEDEGAAEAEGDSLRSRDHTATASAGPDTSAVELGPVDAAEPEALDGYGERPGPPSITTPPPIAPALTAAAPTIGVRVARPAPGAADETGAGLVSLRSDAGLTQRDAASRFGVSASTIARAELAPTKLLVGKLLAAVRRFRAA